MAKMDIVVASMDLGVNVKGASSGAKALASKLKLDEIKVYMVKQETVEREYDKNIKKKNLNAVVDFNERLYSKINELDNTVLTIGGDHSIAIGSALASINKYDNLGIIWIDAHGDYNTFETTITGNLHGLPLAVVTNYEKKLLSNFHKGNKYNPKNAVIVGGRDFDELEYKNIIDAGVTVFTTEDIKKIGVKEVIKKAIDIASNGTKGIHVSFDIDVIDPRYAMGVSVPASNGINVKTANEIIDNVLLYNNIIKSYDVVEYNNLRDKNDRTLKIAKNICNKIISKY